MLMPPCNWNCITLAERCHLSGHYKMDQLFLHPIAATDPFGTAYKHRAFRLLVDTNGSIRKVCWVLLERDGSVSVGLSDPGILITEVGTAHTDPMGRVSAAPDAPGPTSPASARTNPHITLHRSGICHVRTNHEEPLVQLDYGNWCPPLEPLEWLHLFTSPIAALPTLGKVKVRDAVLVMPRMDHSLGIRVDVLPRSVNGKYPLLGGEFHTVVGIAPDYAVRLTSFAHQAVHPQILVKTPCRSVTKMDGP
jgi:hypothetical protein